MKNLRAARVVFSPFDEAMYLTQPASIVGAQAWWGGGRRSGGWSVFQLSSVSFRGSEHAALDFVVRDELACFLSFALAFSAMPQWRWSSGGRGVFQKNGLSF